MDSQEFELEVGETLRIGPHVVTILDLDLESIALRLEVPEGCQIEMDESCDSEWRLP